MDAEASAPQVPATVVSEAVPLAPGARERTQWWSESAM